ncbi:MAG: UvrD-helicase domain-containing protein, partial [Rudaea sp.]
MTALEWQRMPLDGRVLIEASAGTGKTFTIGLIYLRLLLERGLCVEQILVATFTNAAAQELRDRLRKRLVEAERLLRTPIAVPADGDESDSLAGYLVRICPNDDERNAALRKVQLARADIDRAPIATIHALCARIQRDYPLQTGTGFAADNLVDESELLQECVEDFWRRRYLTGAIDIDEADAVLGQGPEGLLPDLRSLMTHNAKAVDANGMAELERCVDALKDGETIAELRWLADNKTLYAGKKHALSSRLRSVADVLEGEDPQSALAGLLDDYFESKTIAAQQPESPETDLRTNSLIIRLQHLRDLFKNRKTFSRGTVLAAALEFCRSELPRRARQRNAQTYAMQIDQVHRRLPAGEEGAALADFLFDAFPVALIDEFQDTDARQFEIFNRIYSDAGGRTRGLLTMIGDPKQAIFGFRGGDIATYERAIAQVTQRFSLDVNYRSSSALITGLNQLYEHTDGGFDNEQIVYRHVRPSPKADDKPYTRAGAAIAAPLRIHRFRADPTEMRLGKLEDQALDDCAQRVVELLNDPDQAIGGKRIGPGDIAVLLSTNKQVGALRKRLVARGVPCVGGGRGNVFETDVARELELILFALVNPDDDRAVRGALGTRLLGANLANLLEWQVDESAFATQLEAFAGWREQAQRRGIMAFIEALLDARAPILLGSEDGERTLTDLRHLGELLAEHEALLHGLDGLYAWFAATRRDADAAEREAADARQLRIESDGARVQLLTLHLSKGLEFPIVFLPLVWRTSNRTGKHAPKALYFHDDANQPRVDLGSADFSVNRGRHFREELQERLRVLYVALTRAEHAVHVYWADRNVSKDSDDKLWELPSIDVVIRQAQEDLGLEFGEVSLDALATALGGIEVIGAAALDHKRYLAASVADTTRIDRPTLPQLRPFQWLHSFSALTRMATQDVAEPAAADESEVIDVAAQEFADVLAATASEPQDSELLVIDDWRGRRFGNAVHKVLELAAPGAIWPQQRDLLATQLNLQAV